LTGSDVGPDCPEVVEVRYKGYRHGFCENPRRLPITPGMAVVVGVDAGCDLARVGLGGSFVPVSKEDVPEGMEIHPILRIATEADLKIERRNAVRERKALRTCNELVARHCLPMKLLGAEYRHDRGRLVEYNLRDAQLALRILRRLKLVELAVERSRLTGLPPDRVAASIASFDFLYLTELRRRGIAAPTVESNRLFAELPESWLPTQESQLVL